MNSEPYTDEEVARWAAELERQADQASDKAERLYTGWCSIDEGQRRRWRKDADTKCRMAATLRELLALRPD
jgi:hypothetical protein